MSHFLIELEKHKIHLKCDNYDEKNEWIKAILFMKEKFETSVYMNQAKYKEKLDDETKIQIYAENEWANWEDIRVRTS
jgi:hypothetical protein